MKIAKPILLVTTPAGVAIGLYEGYELAGGLVFLLFCLVAMFGVAILTVVSTIRSEARTDIARQVDALALEHKEQRS